MKNKHTPGPWAIDAGLDGAVIYNGSGTIANVPEDLLASSFNARLIVAAPDLLAALERLTETLDAISLSDEEAWTSDLIAARAAIAKATGGAR